MSLQNETIYVYWKNGEIEETTSKKYHEENISLNKNLFFWSNNEKDPDWKYINDNWEYIGKKETPTYSCQSCGSRPENCIC